MTTTPIIRYKFRGQVYEQEGASLLLLNAKMVSAFYQIIKYPGATITINLVNEIEIDLDYSGIVEFVVASLDGFNRAIAAQPEGAAIMAEFLVGVQELKTNLMQIQTIKHSMIS